MGNLFGGLARPANNRGATAEAIPVVRDKATESEKEAERYICIVSCCEMTYTCLHFLISRVSRIVQFVQKLLTQFNANT